MTVLACISFLDRRSRDSFLRTTVLGGRQGGYGRRADLSQCPRSTDAKQTPCHAHFSQRRVLASSAVPVTVWAFLHSRSCHQPCVCVIEDSHVCWMGSSTCCRSSTLYGGWPTPEPSKVQQQVVQPPQYCGTTAWLWHSWKVLMYSSESFTLEIVGIVRALRLV